MVTEAGERRRDATAAEQPPRPWTRVAGVAVPVAAAGVVVAMKLEIVRATFSSAESLLRVVAVVAGWALFSRLLRRVVPNPLVRTLLVAVPAAALLWVNVGPYFRDDAKVTDSFPESFTVAEGAAESPAGPPQAEAGPGTAVPAPPPLPVQLSSGRFRGLDGHRGSGEASVFRQPDGSHIVAFRDVSVSSVPDPVLYLVPGPDREGIDGAIRLGRFDAGRDRYELPAGVDPKGPLTVLIWCQRFAVPVAGATQSAV